MPAVTGTVYSFAAQSGAMAYNISFAPPDPNATLFFKFGNSGVDPAGGGLGTPDEVTGMHFLGFTGQSGKVLDNEGNYVHSYTAGQQNTISGNIFSGYHNYFINDVPVNLDCNRRTGDINCIFVSNINDRFFQARVNIADDSLSGTCAIGGS